MVEAGVRNWRRRMWIASPGFDLAKRMILDTERILVWTDYLFKEIKPPHVVKLEGAEVEHHVLEEGWNSRSIEL